MSRTKYSLTAAHRAELKPWADKWIANGLRTEPQTEADREAMRVAMRGLYAAAKLPAPDREIFVAGPISGAIAASIAGGVIWLRDNPAKHVELFGRTIGEPELMSSLRAACAYACTVAVQSSRGEPFRAPMPAATSDATDAATYAATDAATRAATDAATLDATLDATLAATSAATRDATAAATSAATAAATRAATSAATRAATHAATSAATAAATRDATLDATLAATYAATRDATSAATAAATRAATRDATRAATRAATSAATAAATRAATSAATRAATAAATSAATAAATRDATRDATHAATYAATAAATYAATDAATDAATAAATRDATSAATAAATRAATSAATSAATAAATRAATSAATYDVVAFLVRCCAHWGRYWSSGNHWSGWVAYLSFFRHVAKLGLPEYDLFRHYEAATIHGSHRFMHRSFWVVSDFPTTIGRDAQARPHADNGPSLAWRDGFALHYVHGVRVPADIIEHPESITISRIEKESNAEVRRVMIDRYGADRYLLDSGAKVASEDKYGALLVKSLDGDEPLTMVRVRNSTPEPDGTRKDYYLRVPPSMRTPHEAVAWTFGLTPSEYAPAIET